jgi:histidine triad (HIT) family protein
MDYQGNDFYCDIALKGLVDLEIEYEDEEVLAFHHTNPFWPVHIVIIPKAHVPSLIDLGDYDETLLLKVLSVVQMIAKKVTTQQGAARVLTNLGGYQDSKHLHFHVNSGDSKY